MRYLQRRVIIVIQGQKYTNILPVSHGILQIDALAAVVLQGAEPRKDTLIEPAVPSRVETSAVENTVRDSGQLGVASQSHVEALEAKMKAMDIEHAERIEAMQRENAQRMEIIERGYAQRVKEIEREYAQRIDTMKVIEAKHAQEMSDIREKVGCQ